MPYTPGARIKILHLEDSSLDAQLVQRELKNAKIDFETLWVANKDDYQKALKDYAPDIILSDHTMANFDSMGALQMAAEAGVKVPFILVTCTVSEEYAADVMRKGAYDYVLKDHLQRLPNSVLNAVKKSRDQKASAQLAELVALNEQQFRNTLNSLLEGIQIHDFNWRYIYVNDALVKRSSFTREELLGHTIMELYPGVEQTDIFKAMHRCMVAREPQHLQSDFTFADGAIVHFELSIQPIPEGISVLSVDRTEQKKAQEKLQNTSRLLSFISQVNQNIVRVKDEATLFASACKIAVEFGKFKMGWIGLFDFANLTLNKVEHCGIPEAILSTFTKMPLQPGGPQQGVINTGTYYVCNNIQQNAALQSWKPMAIEQKVNSCIILPIKKAGVVVGSFSLYAAETDFFDTEEIELLQQVANDISFALDSFEKAKQLAAAQQQLVFNQNRFKAIIEKGVDMVTLRDVEGALLYVSPSVNAGLGYSTHEILGTQNVLHLHPDDIAAMNEQVALMRQIPGSSFFRRQRLKHKNGHWVWCEGTITNLLDEPGVNAVVSNFRDVSDRMAIEEQLEYDRQNFMALINNTNDLMWGVDLNFNLISHNQPLADVLKMMGGNELVKGTNMLNFALSAEQAARFKSYYERAFNGESFTEVEYYTIPAENWTAISYHPIRFGNEIIGAACHTHDITESKNAVATIQQLNESMAAANQQLSTILNTLPANIALLNKEGTIIGINEAWKKFAIVNEMDSNRHGMGDNYIAVCQNATGADVEHAEEMAVGTLKVLQGELEGFALEYPCHSLTEKRWFRVEVRPLTEGLDAGAVVMHINVTDRKIAQDGIEELNAQLEDRVSHRTRALMDANTSLEAFSYSVSHDLRSPVRSIMGFVKIIVKEYGDTMNDDQKDLFSHVENSARRMNAIIDDLLLLCKTGTGSLNITEFNLTALFHSVWDNISVTNPHNAVLELPPLPYVYADNSMLQQVIVNLLSNAIKYSSKKEDPRVTVGYTQNAEKTIIWVKDNGAGFNMKYYDRLFEAFQRLHTFTDFEGTGVGLALIKRVIDRHGGSVWAEGVVNEGATFYFTLPRIPIPQSIAPVM
ncbi:MAG: PAS domain S-box protein, partial [Chitinophagales bacterium]|nr:PAS domain S-box protein [Chitinophagales bacterium]